MKMGRKGMLEEIIQEIDGMGYPSQEIGRDLEGGRVTDRYTAAAYGFQEAKDRIAEIIRSHSNDGWIPCSGRMPENEKEVEITYTWKHPDGRNLYGTARAFYTDGTMTTEDSGYNWEDTGSWKYCGEIDAPYIPEGWWECVAFGENFSAVDQKVIAWRHCAEPNRPVQKSLGENYKQQIMERFLKVE